MCLTYIIGQTVNTHIYIYIYIYRERERQRDRETERKKERKSERKKKRKKEKVWWWRYIKWLINDHIFNDSNPLTLYLPCNSLHLTSTSMAPKMTPKTIIRFHSFQTYVTDELCNPDWVDLICLPYNFAAYDHMPLQSGWWFATLDANDTGIVGRMMRKVGRIDLLLVAIMSLHIIYITCPWQQ